MNSKIWLSSPHMGGTELKYIQNAFDTNWIAPLGPNVNQFEKEIENYLGIENCAVLISGTSSIHMALILLNVNRGDEVICQSFTFSATANPIVYQKATPVFVDSEPETWNMDPELLEEAIIDRIAKGKKPKAIIVVHLYGMPAKMKDIMNVGMKYEIPIIEDAAEALGSKYIGKNCGTFGIMGILSFNGNKIITTSGGGALVSNDKNLIKKARFLSTQAREDAPHYQHSEIGYNYRMSNILAGIGLGQMEVLDLRVSQRRENNRFYRDLLSNYKQIRFHTETVNSRSNYWLTSFILEKSTNLSLTTEQIRKGLDYNNIECRPLWKPMHLQPIFNTAPAYLNGFSEYAFTHGLCLPSGSNLTEIEKDRIAACLLNILD
jgi:dTDP-4-amino-4,6-dideoxygalactose transaminase